MSAEVSSSLSRGGVVTEGFSPARSSHEPRTAQEPSTAGPGVSSTTLQSEDTCPAAEDEPSSWSEALGTAES